MKIIIEYGHTLEELGDQFEELWDFPYNELFDGTIEPQDNMTYWLINGRLYEMGE